MARSLNSIYDALALEKSTQPSLLALVPNIDTAQTLLNDLDTASRVKRWRLMLWVVAVAIWTHEKLWDLFKAEIDIIAAGSYIGTLPWYVRKAKEFQYGYALVDINNVPGYAVDDPVARIVARAAGKEQGGTVLLKLAKTVGSALGPLSAPELASFDAYMDEVKMAGSIINLLSVTPDLLKLVVKVRYDPLVMAPNGSLILQPGVFPVEDAVEAYLANMPFDGVFIVNAIIDAMQAAQGVVDPQLVNAYARYGFFAFQIVHNPYSTYAGYMIVDPINPLSATIQYVPYV